MGMRRDNRPEFTSRRMLGRAEGWKLNLVHIRPGRPMENGYVMLPRPVPQ